MNRTRLFILGMFVAVAGFGGMWWGQHYIESHPGIVLGDAILGVFNVESELPFEARIALFFKDSGAIIGVVGLVVAAVAFVFTGKKGRL